MNSYNKESNLGPIWLHILFILHLSAYRHTCSSAPTSFHIVHALLSNPYSSPLPFSDWRGLLPTSIGVLHCRIHLQKVPAACSLALILCLPLRMRVSGLAGSPVCLLPQTTASAPGASCVPQHPAHCFLPCTDSQGSGVKEVTQVHCHAMY